MRKLSGGRGDFSCDRCRRGPIWDWDSAAVVGPLTRDQLSYKQKTGRWPKHWGRRRDYCSLACLRLAEAGHFEELPHHPGCITVTIFVRGRAQPKTLCCGSCEKKDGPRRFVRIAGAGANVRRRRPAERAV